MTDHIGSLSALATQRGSRRLVLLPVFHDFGHILHQLSADGEPAKHRMMQRFNSSSTNDDNNNQQLKNAVGNSLRNLLPALDTALQRMQRFNDAETDANLQRPQWVFDLVFNAMLDPSRTEFPGPMCVPLTRSSIPAIADPAAKYLVCEKSDGLRAIMVSVAMPFLPRWFAVTDVNNDADSPLRPKLNLRDIAVLESTLGRILDGSALRPGPGATTRCNLSHIGEGDLQLHEHREDLFWFVGKVDPSKGAANRDRTLLRRLATPDVPRHATFFIDRSMSVAFLLLDDLPVPQDIGIVIADGELLLPSQHRNNINNNKNTNDATTNNATTAPPTPPLIYTTFDIFSIVNADGINAADNDLNRETMSNRYDILGDKFVTPLRQRIRETAAARRVPLALEIVRKEMVPVTEMASLVRRLSRCSDTGEMLFDGVTPNDGLIFTPDRFDLIAGSRMDQFKWKWPDCLSVDWVVRPLPRGAHPGTPRPVWKKGDDNEEDVETLLGDVAFCEMFWFFRRRAARDRLGEQDAFGHAFAGHAWLWNPKKLPLQPQYLRSVSGVHQGASNTAANPQQAAQLQAQQQQAQQRDVASIGGTVVECSFVPLSAASCREHLSNSSSLLGVWKAERVRPDKNSANAVTSVLAVMESVAESLGIAELLQALSPSGGVGFDAAAVLHPSLINSAASQDSSNVNSNSKMKSSSSVVVVDLQVPPAAAPTADATPPTTTTDAVVTNSNNNNTFASCYFGICCVPENHVKLLRLQWRVKLATKPFTCNHVDARKAVAYCNNDEGTDTSLITGSRLDGILTMALANDGGCIGWSETCVRARYSLHLGRWVVEEICPESSRVRDQSFCSQILKHLVFLIGTVTFATVSGSNNNSAKFADHERRCVVKLQHPTVPIKDTSATRNTSEHYDAVASLLGSSGGANNNGNSNEARLAGVAAEKGRGLVERSDLRRHNNWVKQVLLIRALEERGLGLTPSGEKVKATLLDLCSGRGGDLHKYAHSPLKFLVMVDASFESAAEAARRYCNLDGMSYRTRNRGSGIPATFAVADCFDDKLVSEIVREQVVRYPAIFSLAAGTQEGGGGDAAAAAAQNASFDSSSTPATTTQVFDLVSCQFSLHYSCSSESRLRGFLRAVGSSLCIGGVFFGTTVDDSVVLQRREKRGDKFGNDCYKVEFLPNDDVRRLTYDPAVRSGAEPLLSQGYLMDMDECVQGALEYIVPFDTFVRVALEEGLMLVEEVNFKDFFDVHRKSSVGRAAFAAGARGANAGGGAGAGGANRRQRAAPGTIDASSAASIVADVDFNLSAEEQEAAWIYRTVLLRKFC